MAATPCELEETIKADYSLAHKLCADYNASVHRINEIHEKLALMPEDQRGPAIERQSQKLWSMYQDAKRISIEQEKRTTAALNATDEVLRARALAAKRAAAIAAGNPLPEADMYEGQECVGRVGDDWILVTAQKYLGNDMWEVQDEDPAVAAKPISQVHRRSLIPLPPKSTSPTLNENGRGSMVLGMYPQTTSFYRCSVVAPPSVRGDTNYELKFDGEEIPGTTRVVSAWLVVKETAL